jgi:large subunit ribosomal protein L16
MLMPAKVKYRKQHRGHRRGQAKAGNTIAFGEYGLVALANCWMTARQIEAARVAMTRFIRRAGKVWVRVFPDKPVTAKPAETRMGGGKGAPDHWVAVVKRGRVLFEMAGVTPEVARTALTKAARKLPILTRVVMRTDSSVGQGGGRSAAMAGSESDEGSAA